MPSNSKESLSRKTMRGFFLLFSSSIAQAIIQFVIMLYLARLLSPKDFGVIGLATVILTFVSILSSLGIGPALIQRSEINQAHIQTSFAISLSLNVLFAISIYLSSAGIADFFNMPELDFALKLLSFVCIIQGFSVVSESLLMRNLEFRKTTVIDLISIAGYGVTGITLAYLHFGVLTLVIAYIVQAILKSVLLLINLPHEKKIKLNVVALKELIYYGGGHSIGRLFNQLAINVDNLIVGRFLGADALGYYSRAYQLLVLPANLFGKVVDSVLFPSMSKVQNEHEKLRRAYLTGIKFIAIMVIPISVYIFTIAHQLVSLLFGEKWMALVIPLQILSVGMLFRTSYKISDSLSRAIGSVYPRAWRQAIYFISVVAGAWIGQHWGIVGVSYGVIVAIFINYLLMAQLSLKLIRSNWLVFFNSHVSSLILAIILFIETSLLRDALISLKTPSLLVILITMACFILTFITMVLVWPKLILGLTREQLISSAVQYIPEKIKKRLGISRKADN